VGAGMTEEFKKMIPQIRSIIKKLSGFSNAWEEQDYFQEAALAYLEAQQKYRKAAGGGRTKMQPQVYCQFRIKKRLQAMASQSGEVVYNVYSPAGEFVRTLSNNEYRKKKKKLEFEGFLIRSEKLVESIYKEDAEGKSTELQIEGDINGDGGDGNDFDRN